MNKNYLFHLSAFLPALLIVVNAHAGSLCQDTYKAKPEKVGLLDPNESKTTYMPGVVSYTEKIHWVKLCTWDNSSGASIDDTSLNSLAAGGRPGKLLSVFLSPNDQAVKQLKAKAESTKGLLQPVHERFCTLLGGRLFAQSNWRFKAFCRLDGTTIEAKALYEGLNTNARAPYQGFSLALYNAYKKNRPNASNSQLTQKKPKQPPRYSSADYVEDLVASPGR